MNILDSLCMSHGLCTLGVCQYDTRYASVFLTILLCYTVKKNNFGGLFLNILDSLCMSHGLCTLGVCQYDTLLPQMSEAQRTGLARRIDCARSVLVTVLPYPADAASGNLSLYARAKDYHTVLESVWRPPQTPCARNIPIIPSPYSSMTLPYPRSTPPLVQGLAKSAPMVC